MRLAVHSNCCITTLDYVMCSVTNLNDHPKDAYVGSVFMCFSLL